MQWKSHSIVCFMRAKNTRKSLRFQRKTTALRGVVPVARPFISISSDACSAGLTNVNWFCSLPKRWPALDDETANSDKDSKKNPRGLADHSLARLAVPSKVGEWRLVPTSAVTPFIRTLAITSELPTTQKLCEAGRAASRIRMKFLALCRGGRVHETPSPLACFLSSLISGHIV